MDPAPAPSSDGRRERRAAFIVAVALVAGAWLGTGPILGTQAAPAADDQFDLAAAVPMDTAVHTDTLGNGLRYYVRDNSAWGKSVELRLVVRAGSVQEEPDQRGLAHAVEHMAFRGTSRFGDGEIDGYLRSLGMRSAVDINASTSADATIYRLTMPSAGSGRLAKALDFLQDIARSVAFDSATAARERGVVLEEWRLGRDASDVFQSRRDSALLAGTRYAERDVIGDTAVLSRFDVRAMRRFYQRWYRPNRMAVVVVGDVSPGTVRGMIEDRFGDWSPAPALPDDTAGTPLPGPRLAVFTRGDAMGTAVELWSATPRRRDSTIADVRQRLAERLFDAVLNARLEDAARAPGAPFRTAAVDDEHVATGLDARGLRSRTSPQEAPLAAARLAAEARRLARDGPLPTELDRERRVLLAEAGRRIEDDEIPPSSSFADNCVSHFLSGNAMLSNSQRWTLYSQLLPEITPADLAAVARQRADPARRVVVVTAPSGAPLDRGLLQLAARDSTMTLAAYVDSAAAAPLISIMPQPGRIVSERALPGVTAWEWRLSNGMRVILKPTPFRADQLLLRAFAPGGASLAPDDEFPSAYLSDALVQRMGVGEHSAARLARLLEGQPTTVSSWVDHLFVGLNGEGSARAAEQLFQLAHLYLAQPRRDDAAFEIFRAQRAEMARQQIADPEQRFAAVVDSLATGGNRRLSARGTAFYSAVSLNQAMDFYRARFANGRNFTIVLVGTIDLEQLRPLVEKYLASIPAGHEERAVDRGPEVPAQPAMRVVQAGDDPKAIATIAFAGPLAPTADATLQLSALRELVEATLGDALRQRLGGTYDVDVDLTTRLGPRPSYRLDVQFHADPARLDTLVRAATAEIARLRGPGPEEAEVRPIAAAWERDVADGLQDNEWWTSELVTHLEGGWSVDSIPLHTGDAATVTSRAMRTAARRYLRPSRRVVAELYPARYRATRSSAP